MATKLTKMRLTSVDLVRAGANQEADICLFKSADPSEAAERPTEHEKNIFKRFIAWLTENPTEAATEPHSPIEKADEEPADLETIYKTALIESIQSIYSDNSLTDIEKASMVEQSVEQFQKKNRELLWDIDDAENELDDETEDVLEEAAEAAAERKLKRRGKKELRDRYDDLEEI